MGLITGGAGVDLGLTLGVSCRGQPSFLLEKWFDFNALKQGGVVVDLEGNRVSRKTLRTELRFCGMFLSAVVHKKRAERIDGFGSYHGTFWKVYQTYIW